MSCLSFLKMEGKGWNLIQKVSTDLLGVKHGSSEGA